MTRPEAFTRKEAAAEIGCTEEEVRDLLRTGELKTVACGIRPGLIPRHVLDAYVRRLGGASRP